MPDLTAVENDKDQDFLDHDFCDTIILERIDLEKKPLLVENIYIYTYPYGERTELNGGTESS